MALIEKIMAVFSKAFKWDSVPENKIINPIPTSPLPIQSVPITPAVPVKIKIMPDPYLNTLLPWTTQKNYFHNVRVLCDRAGLTLLQKNIVCACIYVESQFRDYKSNGTPVQNWNKNPDGSVWSTDWGLVQINDWPKFKHIGPGCRFESVHDVLTHPERAAQFMIDTMKKTGKLQPWASYTGGWYKQYLLEGSSMWKLKT